MIATIESRNCRSRSSSARLVAVALMVLSFANAPCLLQGAEPQPDSSEQPVGRLEGQIRLIGKAPPPALLMKLANGLAVPDESLQVDSKGLGIANVLVYLWKPPPTTVIPPPPKEPITIDMVGFRFSPRATFVRVGQHFRFINQDTQANNVHIQPVRNDGLNWLLAPRVQKEGVWKRSEKLPLIVVSDILPVMRGPQLVLDHPWGAVTDSEGRFAIAGLPPGKHELILWHELAGFLDRKWIVEIAAGKTTTSDADFDLARFGNNVANRGGDEDLSIAGPFDLEQPGNGDDIVAGRKLLQRQLAETINRLDRKVQLTDEQRKKLELAGAGEIEHLLDKVQEVRADLALVKPGGGRLKQFQETEIRPLRERLSTDLFGPRSLFGKAQNSILTPEQKGRLKAESDPRGLAPRVNKIPG